MVLSSRADILKPSLSADVCNLLNVETLPIYIDLLITIVLQVELTEYRGERVCGRQWLKKTSTGNHIQVIFDSSMFEASHCGCFSVAHF